MKFGILNIMALPRSWVPDSELRLVRDVMEQVELCDRIGIEYVWQVEHHFLEEYSHSSAAETFLAAASRVTRHIRLASGITLLPPPYNHPARVAERLGMLDLLSEGRAEFGTGESSTFCELDAFGVPRAQKRAMWREALTAITRMMAEEPFRGFQGRFFSMPPRNVIPKPLQKPHPPVWMASTRLETILYAARLGIGALNFGFTSSVDAAKWTRDYYEQLDNCEPIAFTVNPNVAFLAGFLCERDGAAARRDGMTGLMIFRNAFNHFYVNGTHAPAKTDLFAAFSKIDWTPGEVDVGNLCMGTPDQVRKVLEDYEAAGIDQVILLAAIGKLPQQRVCESLELFGKEILPAFKERDAKRSREKAATLEPVIERAMKRKKPSEIPYTDGYTVRADGEDVQHFGMSAEELAALKKATV